MDNLPSLYPDEALISIVRRQKNLHGYQEDTIRISKPTGAHHVPEEIMNLARIVAPYSVDTTALQIAERHSMRPLWRLLPFKSDFDYSLWEQSQRICRECIKSDIKEFGVAYLHRSHNIPGIEFCYKHNVSVDTACPACGLTYLKHSLSAFNECSVNFETQKKSILSEVEIGYSNFYLEILSATIDLSDRVNILTNFIVRAHSLIYTKKMKTRQKNDLMTRTFSTSAFHMRLWQKNSSFKNIPYKNNVALEIFLLTFSLFNDVNSYLLSLKEFTNLEKISENRKKRDLDLPGSDRDLNKALRWFLSEIMSKESPPEKWDYDRLELWLRLVFYFKRDADIKSSISSCVESSSHYKLRKFIWGVQTSYIKLITPLELANATFLSVSEVDRVAKHFSWLTGGEIDQSKVPRDFRSLNLPIHWEIRSVLGG